MTALPPSLSPSLSARRGWRCGRRRRADEAIEGAQAVQAERALLAGDPAPEPDRTTLVTEVAECLAGATRRGRPLALLRSSWDDAPEVADAWGSTAVTAVATTLADRCRAAPGTTATVRLLRADPLGGTLVAVTADSVDALGEAVADLAAALRRPVALGAHRVRPVVTVAARRTVAGEDPLRVLDDVRASIGHARRLSPGSLRWHRPDPARPVSTGVDRLAVVADLAEALAEPGQFGLAFQPLRDLDTGRVVAAEALLRWEHPLLGAQPALATVEAAERSGLMPALGRVVLDGTLAAARSWPPQVTVHANVSVHELREPDYVEGVLALLDRHGVAPGRLLLELTESALATGPDSVVPVLDSLAASGVRLGLDDFGTGWSSIAQLRAAPVDTVKVDRSLTAGVASSPEEFELVRAVLALVAAAGRQVVAEGIEDAVQLAHLRALGCRVGQGYHLGRPQPARALIVD